MNPIGVGVPFHLRHVCAHEKLRGARIDGSVGVVDRSEVDEGDLVGGLAEDELDLRDGAEGGEEVGGRRPSGGGRGGIFSLLSLLRFQRENLGAQIFAYN